MSLKLKNPIPSCSRKICFLKKPTKINHPDLYLNNIKIKTVTYPEFFGGQTVHTSNPRPRHHGWRYVVKFSKCVSPDALNMHYPALSVLRFLCKTFSKLLKFTLQNTLLSG